MNAIYHDMADFEIAHYPSSTSGKLAIVFIGAGGVIFEGRMLEEFKGTLQTIDCGMVFVADKHRIWYNYPYLDGVFAEIAAISSKYDHVASLGQSMGGCGALLCSKFVPSVSRVLSMSPQFSVRPPFVRFDENSWWGDDKVGPEFVRDFSESPVRDNCQLIYGNCSWQDYIHQSMYSACGFNIANIDGASHNVADFLKRQSPNRLTSLVQRLLDFEQPFDRQAIATELAGLTTMDRLHSSHRRLQSVHEGVKA